MDLTAVWVTVGGVALAVGVNFYFFSPPKRVAAEPPAQAPPPAAAPAGPAAPEASRAGPAPIEPPAQAPPPGASEAGGSLDDRPPG